MSFSTEINEHPVGVSYERYENGESQTVQVGDMVYFNDPDAGMHVHDCELTSTNEFIGYVKRVYAVEYSYNDDDVSPEVGSSAPLGRLPVNDRWVTVVPTTGGKGERGRPYPEQAWGADTHAATRMAKTLHDEYEKYYQREHHLGVDCFDTRPENARVCSDCEEGSSTTIINGE